MTPRSRRCERTLLRAIHHSRRGNTLYRSPGGGPGTATTTLVLYIYEAGFESFHFGYASAIALSLFAVVLVVTLAQLAIQRKWVSYD